MRRLIAISLIVVTVKCLLAWTLPLSSDEAYLSLQATHLAGGYYEHPPMAAWVVHGFLALGRSTLLLRLPIIISTALIGLGIYVLVRPYDRQRAYLASLLFIVSPFNTGYFLITTDTPLLLFSFLSASLLFRAETNRRYRYYLLSGVCLGLAFLSKYLAVLLALSYGVYFLTTPKTVQRVKGFSLLFLASLPFVAQNALWNYHHGWPNLMHNWFNRFASDVNIVSNVAFLCLGLIHLLTPPVVYCLIKYRRAVIDHVRQNAFGIFACAIAAPACLLLIISLKKDVGLHWLFSFLPFIYIVLALPFETTQIKKGVRFGLVVSIIQTSFLLVAGLIPARSFKAFLTEKDLATFVMYSQPQVVLDMLVDYETDFIPATKSYAKSALLEFYGSRRVLVFGKGSHHARQDDILTDFTQLDGKNILIFRTGRPDPNDYTPCFSETEIIPVEIADSTFSLVLGSGFKYDAYRHMYLTRIFQAYYQIPEWLPYTGSAFHEKYGWMQ